MQIVGPHIYLMDNHSTPHILKQHPSKAPNNKYCYINNIAKQTGRNGQQSLQLLQNANS